MAIFVDLDNEDETTETQPSSSQSTDQNSDALTTSLESTHLEETSYPTSQPSRPDLTSLAAPYPVICSLASNLDHNDLSNLANTCKQMRENMLQYRNNLLGASLVCSTEAVESEKPEFQRKKRRVLCARDLVARCGTCGEPTCRNCVYKPGKLTEEHRKRLACRARRICRQCQTSPEVLHPDPNANASHKICNCPSKLLWQCPSCRLSSAPLTTHKSFLTLLHHEKLQLLNTIFCTHFRPSHHPPSSQLVWVEECPSPTHPPRVKPADPSLNHKPITCAMEVYPGGWAYQDLTTGYIYRPPSSSCIGATADWWSRLVCDPNEGGLITYPTSADLGPEYTFRRVSCTDPNHPRWALMAGKGLDARGVGVALWSYDQK